MTEATYNATVPLVEGLLGLVALFCLFEAVSMMMAGALKGAGDTLFVAWASILCSWLLLVLPTGILVMGWGGPLFWCWAFFVVNGFAMFLVHWLRFKGAKWKQLKVIA